MYIKQLLINVQRERNFTNLQDQDSLQQSFYKLNFLVGTISVAIDGEYSVLNRQVQWRPSVTIYEHDLKEDNDLNSLQHIDCSLFGKKESSETLLGTTVVPLLDFVMSAVPISENGNELVFTWTRWYSFNEAPNNNLNINGIDFHPIVQIQFSLNVTIEDKKKFNKLRKKHKKLLEHRLSPRRRSKSLSVKSLTHKDKDKGHQHHNRSHNNSNQEHNFTKILENISFESQLEDHQGLLSMSDFFNSIYCGENLEFLIAVKKYKTDPTEDCCNYIINRFILPDSPDQINIPEDNVIEIKSAKYSENIFNKACDYVKNLVILDNWQKYLGSSQFRFWLKSKYPNCRVDDSSRSGEQSDSSGKK